MVNPCFCCYSTQRPNVVFSVEWRFEAVLISNVADSGGFWGSDVAVVLDR